MPRNAHSSNNTSGYVYLIRRGPYYKIGMTKQLHIRMQPATIKYMVQPSSAQLYPPEVLWTLQCVDCKTTERALQQKLTQYSYWGEWYWLNDEIVAWIRTLNEATICDGYDPATYHAPRRPTAADLRYERAILLQASPTRDL